MLRAAFRPMSSRKKASIPLNRSPANGCMASWPDCPVTMPITIAPSSTNCAPSVTDSCRMRLSGVLRTVRDSAASDCSFSRWRTMLASSTAMMIAGDSIKAIAAAMCPP